MRSLLRSLAQLALVAISAAAWTFLTAAIAKTLYDRYSGIPFSFTDPDLWASVAGLVLWIANSLYLCRKPALTLFAKLALWLVLPPMAWFLLFLSAMMRLPG